MRTKFSAFDPAEYLDSDEAIAAYINEVMAENDSDLFLSALNDIARARGMTQVAEASGLGRESLYKALKPGAKPGFTTVDKVMRALGLRMTATPLQQHKPAKPAKPGKASKSIQSAGQLRQAKPVTPKQKRRAQV
ncbi:addiction module antidote protein [Dyella silvatica]|uniref:addiction module antidote protein n=1 Tax=Dyella silvatica TaxID=2992128 RepID=UPI003CCDDBAC